MSKIATFSLATKSTGIEPFKISAAPGQPPMAGATVAYAARNRPGQVEFGTSAPVLNGATWTVPRTPSQGSPTNFVMAPTVTIFVWTA